MGLQYFCRRYWRSSIGAWVLASLCGCVFVPRTTTTFDEDCQTESHHMVLDADQLGSLGHCANQGCVAELVAMGAVATASAIVSGSIVVTGNVVYWIEKQGRCISAAHPAGHASLDDQAVSG